eukprot:g79563.t1
MATLWDASEVDFDSNYPSSPEESSGGEFPDFLTDDSSAATTQVDIPDQNSIEQPEMFVPHLQPKPLQHPGGMIELF